MKKVLLTVIAALAMCGSMLAQSQYESYWPGFDYHAYEMQGGFVAAIKIDGQLINVTDPNWNALEVGFFVDGVCRGNENYLTDFYVEEYGDPFPILDGYPIYYDIANAGEYVEFKMYDHLNGVLYEDFELIYNDEPITVLTGEEHFEGWDDPENPIYLCFTSPETPSQTFTKDIVGYGTNPGGYYLIASPVTNEVTPSADNGFITDEYDLYFFDHDYLADEWRNFKPVVENVGNFNLTNGMGYLYASQEDTQLSFTGTPYSGDGMIELDYNADNAENGCGGWNLVGNPFPEAALVTCDYLTLNEAGDELVLVEDGGEIQAMEGIFVYAEAEGETVTFVPSNGGSTPDPGLVLNISKAYTRGTVDRAIIRFGEGRMLPKFQLNPNHTKVYIPQDGNNYAVVRASEMGEMPVNFKAETSGTYTMSFASENVSFAYLHLIDNLTGADVDVLANPSYTFDASTSDYATRFRLVFVTNDNNGDNFAFYSNGSIVINNEGEATLQVVDVMGRILSSETISGCANVNVDAARGVYMLRLINGNDMKVQKVVVE